MAETVALRQVVLDCRDARRLAEFYRELLGFVYRPGDEQPAQGEPDPRGQDWLVLQNPGGGMQVAFQQVDNLPEATWPDGPYPQMAHLESDRVHGGRLRRRARPRGWSGRTAPAGPIR